MIPITSPITGEIMEFRYTMSEENKISILGKNAMIQDSLAGMSADIISKEATDQNNKSLFILAKADAEQNYEENKRAYVKIGPKVEDKKYRELYRLIPKNSKEEFNRQFPDGVMLIREDVIDMTFGYRKLSLTDWVDRQLRETIGLPNGLHPFAAKIAKIIGKIWEMIIGTAKRNIVIFFPEVLKANVISNWLLLMWKGVPPLALYQHH